MRAAQLAAIGTALVVLVALGLAILSWNALPLDGDSRARLFVATECLAGLLWLAAVATVRRATLPRHALWIVLTAAVAMRALTFAAPPLLSSDIYRYVWDGRVQLAGINPYRYLPDAPELAFLRDATVYPLINRADYAPTIYPPAAEAVFAVAAVIAPGLYGMKAMMTAFDALAIFALLRLLRLAGRNPGEVLIYAWLPMPIWEFVGNGHIDAAAAGLLAMAVLVAAYGRPARTGVMLGAAALTKFLPAVVLPAFWRPRDWRLLAAFVLFVGALYAPYIGIGRRVLGYLGGYVTEEKIGHGGGIFLLQVLDRVVPLPRWAAAGYAAVVLCLLAALAARFVFATSLPAAPGARAAQQARHAAILGAVLLVALSPHYPWYFGWLAPLACVAPLASVAWLLAAAPLLALGPIEHLLIPVAVYVPAAALAVLDFRRRPAMEHSMTATTLKDPRRYFEAVAQRDVEAVTPPVCLYLEVTNRCNLLCETCPRTFEELEPPADMSWELFTRIVDQVPDIARVVLHGVGEPMLVRSLPRMIRYLKDHGVYVLFNTNGTLLSAKKHRELIDTGLDELRVSLDAADAKTFLAVRGKNFFDRIVRNVQGFTALQRELGITAPRVSLWLTGLQETVDQLPAFVRLADAMGVREVYLQRLVFDEAGYGMARAESSLFERVRAREAEAIDEAGRIAEELGIRLDASGATEPGLSLQRQAQSQPWSTCRRPWSLMYFTAHGRALPCCIAPFSARGYETYTLGDATQQTLREIWNGAAYQEFRGALLGDAPPRPCQNCGLRWSL